MKKIVAVLAMMVLVAIAPTLADCHTPPKPPPPPSLQVKKDVIAVLEARAIAIAGKSFFEVLSCETIDQKTTLTGNYAVKVKYSLKFTKGFNEVRKEIWDTNNFTTAGEKILALWRQYGFFKKGAPKEYSEWFSYKIGWIIDQ